jgi:hypothetical protein
MATRKVEKWRRLRHGDEEGGPQRMGIEFSRLENTSKALLPFLCK